eukprot:TRINITY_DN932_c1_g1_i18.p1 TRINITY_DN932_c1_g1~~TRINITY_DN932_c1_g1_i18.p1  ORF type:complete len:361 (-),score=79.99 TRINITY_DN932_c1_g1_i18:89-1171(-)
MKKKKEIMLRGLKVDYGRIKNALLEMNETSITHEMISSIRRNLPTPDQVQLIEGYDNPAELGNAEKYFLAIGKVPMLHVKVRSLEYKYTFAELYEEIETATNVLFESVSLLDGNRKIIALFEVVLALGNYLNGSTSRGGCFGFKLHSITKLNEVRSPLKKDVTLLTFLVQHLRSKNPELLNTFENFGAIHQALRYDITEVSSNLNKLVTGLKPIEEQLKSATCDPNYSRVMGSWAKTSAKQLETLQVKLTDALDRYKKVLKFYAQPENTKSEEFFAIFSEFANQFETCRNTPVLTQTPSKRLFIKKPSERSPAGKQIKPASPTSSEEGELDKLIERMKTGQPLLERKRGHTCGEGPLPTF